MSPQLPHATPPSFPSTTSRGQPGPRVGGRLDRWADLVGSPRRSAGSSPKVPTTTTPSCGTSATPETQSTTTSPRSSAANRSDTISATPAVGSSAQLEPTGLVALDRTESFVDRLGPPNVTYWHRSGAARRYWRTGAVHTLRRELAGSRVARRPPVGSEAGAHGHSLGTKSRLARSPWSPQRSVQTLCRGARPASTSGFTGASSRLEPRPSPSHGDALPGFTALPR
jgi:hypothetical protein